MVYKTILLPMILSGLFMVRSFSPSLRQRYSPTLIMRASKKTKSFDNDPFFYEKSTAPLYKPRGPNQKTYVQHLNDPNVSVLLGVGPAGTGKTLFACATAVQEMRKGKVNKIILTRPVVPVEEDIGFLPGSLINKMHPWTRPIFDILEEFYSQRDIDSMVHSGAIEISPLAFMRGRTFKDAFIIADEMQNSSPNQMLMLATRLGEGSRMVVTGDLKQSDRCENNGLLDLMNRIYEYNKFAELSQDQLHNSSSPSYHDIKTVILDNRDVERSPIVSKILDLYSDKDDY